MDLPQDLLASVRLWRLPAGTAATAAAMAAHNVALKPLHPENDVSAVPRASVAVAVAASKKEKTHPLVGVSAGIMAAFLESSMLFPLDMAKTRLQLDSAGKYRGLFHCIRTVAAEEGYRALYKGVTPFLTHLTLKYILRLGSFSFFKELLADETGRTSPAQNFLAGLGAGVTEAILIVTPFEVVKIRLQAQQGMDKTKLKYRNPIHAAATIVREEGFFALWKGCSPTVMRQGSNQAVNFPAAIMINRYMWDWQFGDERQLPVWQSLTTGVIAGALGPCANCPFDVAKTRMMSQMTKKGEAPKYTGMIQCMRTVAKEEGVRALYKGLAPRLMRVAPGQAISWAVLTSVSSYVARKGWLQSDAEKEAKAAAAAAAAEDD